MLIRDQDYVLLKDGRILAVHGHCHPAGHLVGELAFVPSTAGGYAMFGSRYRKAYVADGRGMSESERELVRFPTGTCFDHAHPFSAKSIVPLSQVDLHLSAAVDPRTDTVPGSFLRRYAESHLTELARILGDTLPAGPLGLTGSGRLLLGDPTVRSMHDYDVVFDVGPEAAVRIARRLSAHGRAHPEARLREHGKDWRIRLRTRAGILCPFFRYEDPADAPLAGLAAARTLLRNVTVSGRVVADAHGAYLPTLLGIVPEQVSAALPGEVARRLPVLVSHLRDRGDFHRGDRGTFTGDLCHLSTSAGDLVVLSVVDGADSRLDDPPWRLPGRPVPPAARR
ncbi:hypothetical protein [Streptomyces cinereospinus]|uniref:Nucleotidyltransferase family protein n=1 Tax=Streptomyces cinereospinus TaxID=285561 RepID=A0ABV5N463_9ACTN